MGKTGSKRSKITVFKVFQKLCYFFYLKLVLNESSLALYLDNSYVGKLWFWVMNKNALTQSDCKIYKLAILQEKLDELTWFLASRYRFKKHRKWFVNFNIPRTLSSYYVTYAFQSESTLYSCRSVRPNGWVFVYELSGSGFESSCHPWNSWVNQHDFCMLR